MTRKRQKEMNIYAQNMLKYSFEKALKFYK